MLTFICIKILRHTLPYIDSWLQSWKVKGQDHAVDIFSGVWIHSSRTRDLHKVTIWCISSLTVDVLRGQEIKIQYKTYSTEGVENDAYIYRSPNLTSYNLVPVLSFDRAWFSSLSSKRLYVLGLHGAIFCCIHPSLYLSVSWAWWDWPLTWSTDHPPSVLWRCSLGHGRLYNSIYYTDIHA